MSEGISSLADARSEGVRQDWAVNADNGKGRLVLLAFRVAQRVWRAPAPLRMLGLPYLVVYRVLVEWVLGIELHWKLQVGPRLRLYHGVGLVVNPDAVIGADCVLRHATTIGRASGAFDAPTGCPVLGDRVDVGPHVAILGPIRVGDDAWIGAGSVVLADVAPGAVVAGNPARELRRRAEEGAGRTGSGRAPPQTR
jgi:putative colanic acid biosynthesis acetyltransferase WcaB